MISDAVTGLPVSDLSVIAVADGHLAFRDVGDGPAVVLLHAGFVDHRMWDEQVAFLSERFRVIAADARGHGGSANASRPFRQCDDVADLLRALGLGPVVLVGVSMGGAIAVETAVEHPDLVRALVVSGAGISEPGRVDRWSAAVTEEQGRALAAGDTQGWVHAWLKGVAGPERTLDDVDPDIVRRIGEMIAHTASKHTVDEPDRTTRVAITPERAAAIQVPVLAVHGGIDAETHIAAGELLVSTVTDGRSTTIDGVGHYPNLERPDEFNAILEEFLAALPRQ
ncbi:alpha/beta fold hydrolase [Yinghuangia seranimata]|uniref:alpha/beta fold hydrolase n=1 Tax=Yinghuangia seranimata TaxID=408067 RepID=UPI00248D2525|nr:alpha/beta hydrolase [Yinghuangia seranimata]MDI2132121.1 alpha/beta hydrolase [Yinghuangia seranimata]